MHRGKAEHPDLLICFELHPGTYVYNTNTFSMIREVSPNLGVNLDPSHFFWRSMDALEVVKAVGDRIGHSHGKDTLEVKSKRAHNSMLESRMPGDATLMAWNFSTVGRGDGRPVDWWTTFVETMASKGFDGVISIEFEDPFVPVEASIVAAAGASKGFDGVISIEFEDPFVRADADRCVRASGNDRRAGPLERCARSTNSLVEPRHECHTASSRSVPGLSAGTIERIPIPCARRPRVPPCRPLTGGIPSDP
jgi:sugar phosphate isomerase/epimerase